MSPLRPGREPAGGCGPESVDDTVKARGVASDLILLTGLGSGEDIEVSGWGEVGTVTRGGIGHSRGSTVRSVHRQWGPMETLHLKSDHVLTSSLWNLPPPPPPPPPHTPASSQAAKNVFLGPGPPCPKQSRHLSAETCGRCPAHQLTGAGVGGAVPPTWQGLAVHTGWRVHCLETQGP